MTEIRRDRNYFKRLYNCVLLGLIAGGLFVAMGEASLLPATQLLKWSATLLLITSLCMAMISLGGPYYCPRCRGALQERRYGNLIRHYCQRCDIEWVTDWQHHAD